MAKNMKTLDIKLPLFMSHGVASKKFIELTGDAANGIILPAGKLIIADQLPDSDPQKKLLIDYVNNYQKKFNSSPSTFGGHAYDALKIIVEAIKMAGATDRDAIRDNIEKVKGDLRKKKVEISEMQINEKVSAWKDIALLRKELREKQRELDEREGRMKMLDKILREGD